MKTLQCSYCNQPLGNSYSFNSIFVTPTIYKCKRKVCNILKKIKYYQLDWGQTNYGKPVKRMLLKLINKINF